MKSSITVKILQREHLKVGANLAVDTDQYGFRSISVELHTSEGVVFTFRRTHSNLLFPSIDRCRARAGARQSRLNFSRRRPRLCFTSERAQCSYCARYRHAVAGNESAAVKETLQVNMILISFLIQGSS